MNNSLHLVRQRRVAAPAAADRRVRRTQVALIDALVALVLEKRYDAITIQDLLDRADVGRSTFYSHYRGKDDLVLRSFEGLIAMLDQAVERDASPARRLAPVRELFEHIGAFGPFHRALARAHMLDRVYQVGTDFLSARIARRLESRAPSAGVPVAPMAAAYAGALFALLRWWLEHDMPFSPDEMDRMYHRMVPA
jgi:AcrR family transcriptional regulator